METEVKSSVKPQESSTLVFKAGLWLGRLVSKPKVLPQVISQNLRLDSGKAAPAFLCGVWRWSSGSHACVATFSTWVVFTAPRGNSKLTIIAGIFSATNVKIFPSPNVLLGHGRTFLMDHRGHILGQCGVSWPYSLFLLFFVSQMPWSKLGLLQHASTLIQYLPQALKHRPLDQKELLIWQDFKFKTKVLWYLIEY